jgi:hypothetical protein
MERLFLGHTFRWLVTEGVWHRNDARHFFGFG